MLKSFADPTHFGEKLAMKANFPISANFISGLFILFDSLAILASGLALHHYMVSDANLSDEYLAAISFIWLTTIMLLNFGGLYQFEAITRPLSVWDKLIISFVTAFLFLLAIAFALKVSSTFSRVWIVSFAATSATSTVCLRLFASYVVNKLSDIRTFTRHVLIVGGGDQARRLIEHYNAEKPRFVSLVGIFANEDEVDLGAACCPRLGRLDQLLAYARNNRVDDVVIAMPWSQDGELMRLIATLRELPLNIYLSSDLIGFRVSFRPPPSHFSNLPILQVMGRPLSGWDVVAKTVEDYVLATLAIVVLLPVFALLALAVKLDSPGPVFFKQKRLGFNNRAFTIYKFRTMRHEADKHGKTKQAQRNDPRVTRLGYFLRRTSLDELPQLINVLDGSMSLVGPRPHAIDHNEDYAQQIRGYFARHRVKPGITGWAQVNGLRGETDTLNKMEARVSHDIYYTENWSLLFDLKILMRTIVISLGGKNAY